MTIMFRGDFASRVSYRLHTLARRSALTNELLKLDHQVARARHSDKLPVLSPALYRLYAQLRTRGVVQCPLAEFGAPTHEMLRVADTFVAALRERPSDGTEDYFLTPDDALLASPEPYLFGLSEPLLDLAENYLGLAVDYLGVNVKREIANGKDVRTRHFHFDPEDERILKIIVYLNDVDLDGGPFECLDAATSARMAPATDYFRHGSSLDDVRAQAPRESWVTCPGPRLTANLADTARCLHRATPPTKVDRYSMTFSYLSRKAYLVFADGKAVQAQFAKRWGHLLTPRQLACVSQMST